MESGLIEIRMEIFYFMGNIEMGKEYLSHDDVAFLNFSLLVKNIHFTDQVEMWFLLRLELILAVPLRYSLDSVDVEQYAAGSASI